MSYTFLSLTNRVLKAFNEVQLTSSNFASAVGFHADCQDSINRAIVDIYTQEDTEWPFAWAEYTTNTVAGTVGYSKNTSATSVDWDSFYIKRVPFTLVSLISTGTTATATTGTDHNFITGDIIPIRNATPTGYNGDVSITVTGSTTFTYNVASGLTSPATGTIKAFPSYTQLKLPVKSYDQYEQENRDNDGNVLDSTGYSKPKFVVRNPDNNFILSGVPDRVYLIGYNGFTIPDALALYSDVPAAPAVFEQAIVDKALHYAYMFRDNAEEAAVAEDRFIANIRNLRRVFITQDEYMRFEG